MKAEDGWAQGEDHIALELEYMQICTQRAIAALDADNLVEASSQMMCQYNMIVDHLATWIPYLTGDMLKFAQTDFYRGLAYLTRGFIVVDQEFLENVLSEELDAARGLEAE